jgi:hypothetical protein
LPRENIDQSWTGVWFGSWHRVHSQKGFIWIEIRRSSFFRALLAETLYDIGYVPSRADPDVWLRPAVTPDDDPELSLQELQSAFKLKDKKVEEPEMYLRAQLGKMQIDGENVGRCRLINMFLLLSRMLKRH